MPFLNVTDPTPEQSSLSRLIQTLGAHIQLVSNGRLFIIQATALLALPHSMALSEVANAWWGTLQPLSIAASQAGATGGEAWHELVLKAPIQHRSKRSVSPPMKRLDGLRRRT